MLRIWQELDRLENIFLELLDDPYKKEILLYPICYCQIVRRYGDYEVDLQRLIKCADKPYKLIGGSWQDYLLELGIFYVKDESGKIYTGKDLLFLTEDRDLKVCITGEYREDFYKFYARLLKYWSVLSSRLSYGKINTPEAGAYMLSLTFNEKLFKEARYYAEILAMRYPRERDFFTALKLLSDFYQAYLENGEIKESSLRKALGLLNALPGVYYRVNVQKLRKDLEKLLKSLKKESVPFLRIEFWREKKKEGFLRRIIRFLKSKIPYRRKREGELFFSASGGYPRGIYQPV